MQIYISILGNGIMAGGGLCAVSWLIGYTISSLIRIMKG